MTQAAMLDQAKAEWRTLVKLAANSEQLKLDEPGVNWQLLTNAYVRSLMRLDAIIRLVEMTAKGEE
jgi:hypothetical protein